MINNYLCNIEAGQILDNKYAIKDVNKLDIIEIMLGMKMI